MTPSARSTQYLHKLGFIVASVEKVIHMPTAPFPFKRDAFGFGDLLIAKPGFGAALVQVTDSCAERPGRSESPEVWTAANGVVSSSQAFRTAGLLPFNLAQKPRRRAPSK